MYGLLYVVGGSLAYTIELWWGSAPKLLGVSSMEDYRVLEVRDNCEGWPCVTRRVGVDVRNHGNCQVASTGPLHANLALKGAMPSTCNNALETKGVGLVGRDSSSTSPLGWEKGGPSLPIAFWASPLWLLSSLFWARSFLLRALAFVDPVVLRGPSYSLVKIWGFRSFLLILAFCQLLYALSLVHLLLVLPSWLKQKVL